MSAFNAFQPSTSSSGGIFGSTNQQQQPLQTGSGLFGAVNQQPAAPSLFGNTQSTPSGSTIFGNPPAATQNLSGGGGFGGPTNQSSGVGLFGNSSTSQQPATSGSLFGNTNANQQPPSSSLFGSMNTNQQQPSGGVFGNTNTNQPQQANLGGSSLFGAQQGHPQGGGVAGGIFGNTSTTGGGGLFGKPGLFGTTPATTTNQNPPSLFSQTQNNQQQPSSFFAQPPQPQQQQPAGSFFNQPPQSQQQGNSFFSQPQQQRQAGSLFGSTLTQPATINTGNGGLFGNTNTNIGASTSNNLLSKTSLGPLQQQTDAQSQFTTLAQRIDGIAQAWNSNSPQCRFQHYFYNLVEPSQASLYARPQNAWNEDLWQRAARENPDPTCLVPVLAIGFDDLQQRVNAQSQQAAAHQEKLKELKKRIEALSQRHSISNASRIQRASALQTQITHRLLKLIQHLHLLIPSLRSSSIRPEEEVLRVALEEIDEQIRRPGSSGMGRMRGKLNELWALVGAVKAARERGRKERGGGVEWTVVDDEGLAQIAQILTEQQTGLSHLTKVLKKDLQDLAIIRGTDGRDHDVEVLFTSSTRRASARQ